VDEHHEVRYDGMAPHGHYCVPIMRAKTVLGVINLYLNAGHQRDDKEIEFLNAIASALAGIIQRKRTEEEREKLIGDLRTVLDAITRSYKE
jgi:GAF domain-containing protein